MQSYDELKKIKYHIRMLSEAMDTYETRFTQLVIENDYSEEQVEAIQLYVRVRARLENV